MGLRGNNESEQEIEMLEEKQRKVENTITRWGRKHKLEKLVTRALKYGIFLLVLKINL